MISFIVIGRNEEMNLHRCFNSIHSVIKSNSLSAYELIYVDSNSVDRSLSIVEGFRDVKIYRVTGYVNAAIARNVGAMKAKGDVFFFIDADMEINDLFINHIIDKDGQIEYDIVSGLVIDVENDKETEIRFQDKNNGGNRSQILDGGVFLIKRAIWQELRGMRTRFDYGEDGDLGLRLSSRGYIFTRLNEPIVRHHTIHYYDRSRMWSMVWKRSIFYSRCVLYRDHLLKKAMYRRLWRHDKTLIIFTIAVPLAILLPSSLIITSPLYLLTIIMRSLKQGRRTSVVEFAIYFSLVDVLNFVYFLSFFPQEKRIEYIALREGTIEGGDMNRAHIDFTLI